MTTPAPQQAFADLPAWAFEYCAGCARCWSLDIYQLSCCRSCNQCCHDHGRRLFAVAWICEHCDRVIESVGLYTSWGAAQDGRRRTLRQRMVEGTTRWRGTAESGQF